MYGLNFLILRMDHIQKTFKNALRGRPNVQNLFSSAQALIDSNDTVAIHSFLELGHLPSVSLVMAEDKKVDKWFNLTLA